MKMKDPRMKILVSIALIITSLVLSKILFLVPILTGIVCISLIDSKFSKTVSYLSFFKYLLPIIFIINWIFYAGGGAILSLNLKIFEISLTFGGLFKSSLICLRLITIAFTAAWLVVTTPPEEFEYGLKKLGFPWKLAFISSLTMKLIPEMKRKFREIEEAQRGRGIKSGGNPIEKIRRKVPILVPFLASISRYGLELSQVLKVRGFSSERTWFKELEFEKND